MALYYDNLTNEWKEFIMPEEVKREIVDLRPFVDLRLTARLVEILTQTGEIAEEARAEIAALFEQANVFTRLRMWKLIFRTRPGVKGVFNKIYPLMPKDFGSDASGPRETPGAPAIIRSEEEKSAYLKLRDRERHFKFIWTDEDVE